MLKVNHMDVTDTMIFVYNNETIAIIENSVMEPDDKFRDTIVIGGRRYSVDCMEYNYDTSITTVQLVKKDD